MQAISKDIECTIWKCSMLVLKKAKLIKSQRIKLDDGEVIKEKGK